MATVCTCGAGHETFGACLRAKNIGYMGVFVSRSGSYTDGSTEKRWQRELQAYRDARAEGIQPATTRRQDIEVARQISDHAGKAYDASTQSFSDGTPIWAAS